MRICSGGSVRGEAVPAGREVGSRRALGLRQERRRRIPPREAAAADPAEASGTRGDEQRRRGVGVEAPPGNPSATGGRGAAREPLLSPRQHGRMRAPHGDPPATMAMSRRGRRWLPWRVAEVLFVCTANVIEMIPSPLLDRMEIISIAGYITEEKMHIARDYLEKNTREASGIKPEQVEVTDDALLALIENYCREAGVRNLQKHIEKIYRKIALKLVRQGASIDPTRDIKIVEANEKPASFDVATELKHENSNNSHAEAVSVDVNPSDSSLDNIDAVPLTTASEIGHNEQSNEAPAESFLDETAKVFNSSSIPEGNESAQRTTKEVVDKYMEKVVVNESNLGDFVGKPLFQAERIYDRTPVGVVMGLAWNSMGGSTLYIETAKVEEREGKGMLVVTGQLGDVMKESAQIAHTVCRAILLEKEPNNPFFAKSKLHLHVPAGATPKDGPSAGCTMVTSMLSLAMGKSVKKDLAMTGEVTLTGRVLPIGGVKEKTIAARRSGVKTIIFPSANRRDFDELASNVKEGLEVHFVDRYNEIYNIAFTGDTDTQEI